jgi:hypothetical protein
MNEASARATARRYLSEHPLDHPDYEWELRECIEKPDIWLFPFCFRCKKNLPPEKWECFAGASAFTIDKADGSVKVVSWAEYRELK